MFALKNDVSYKVFQMKDVNTSEWDQFLERSFIPYRVENNLSYGKLMSDLGCDVNQVVFYMANEPLAYFILVYDQVKPVQVFSLAVNKKGEENISVILEALSRFINRQGFPVIFYPYFFLKDYKLKHLLKLHYTVSVVDLNLNWNFESLRKKIKYEIRKSIKSNTVVRIAETYDEWKAFYQVVLNHSNVRGYDPQ